MKCHVPNHPWFQVLRWLAELARGNKNTVMRELIRAKDQVDKELSPKEADTSEEIIVSPNRVDYGGGKLLHLILCEKPSSMNEVSGEGAKMQTTLHKCI